MIGPAIVEWLRTRPEIVGVGEDAAARVADRAAKLAAGNTVTVDTAAGSMETVTVAPEFYLLQAIAEPLSAPEGAPLLAVGISLPFGAPQGFGPRAPREATGAALVVGQEFSRDVTDAFAARLMHTLLGGRAAIQGVIDARRVRAWTASGRKIPADDGSPERASYDAWRAGAARMMQIQIVDVTQDLENLAAGAVIGVEITYRPDDGAAVPAT